MEMTKEFTEEWHKWIILNIDKGCTLSSIVKIMIENNFDSRFAEYIVNEVVANQKNVDSLMGNEYIYETPRFSHTTNKIETNDKIVDVSVRLEKPVVAVLDNFLSSDECDYLVEISKEKLKRSTIIDVVTGEQKVINDRTSKGTYFRLNENEFIQKIDKRISEVMNWPIENGEGIQILNYKIDDQYKAHFDYFPEQQVDLERGGQRVSTLVMYLNDVEQGGETSFPEIGLSVAPKKGSAVYFEYFNSKGQLDTLTLHSGDPVKKGEKWIATKWMRQSQYK